MIGTVLLVLLCVKIAKLAKTRGRKAAGFVWATIGLWIGGGILGFIIGSLLFWRLTDEIAMMLAVFGCTLLFEIAGGVGAYFITKNCKPGNAAPAAATSGMPAAAPFAATMPAPVAQVETSGAQAQAAPQYCTSCGAPIADSAKFCTNCGAPISREPAAVPAPEPEAQPAMEPVIACEPMPEPVARESVPEAPEQAPLPERAEPIEAQADSCEPPLPEPIDVPKAPETAEETGEQPASAQETPEAGAPAQEAGAPTDRKPAGKRVWLILAGAAVALALILMLSVNAARKKNYAAAVALFDAGGYAEAAEAFDALGSYEDAAERAEAAREAYRQAETFTRACELAEKSDSGALAEAEALFRSLGDYADAPQQAELCRNRLDYDAALKYETEGSFEEALAAFRALGSYEDAAVHARTCSDTLDYTAAMTLFAAGEYEEAAKLLAAPAESGFSDAAEQLAVCGDKLAYAAADALFADGKFYDAYEAFVALGSFEDASARAQGCIQPTPKNGELYHNPAYAKQSAHLRVVNSGSTPSLLKLYAANGDLASTFFILGNKSVTVKVPGGTYSLNQAFGNRWFGEEDLFGDDGEYYECKIEGSKEFTLKSGYIATISRGTGGTPVVNSKTGRGGF